MSGSDGLFTNKEDVMMAGLKLYQHTKTGDVAIEEDGIYYGFLKYPDESFEEAIETISPLPKKLAGIFFPCDYNKEDLQFIRNI